VRYRDSRHGRGNESASVPFPQPISPISPRSYVIRYVGFNINVVINAGVGRLRQEQLRLTLPARRTDGESGDNFFSGTRLTFRRGLSASDSGGGAAS